ncbi:hypothetical protein AGLY_015221 [Aphis glycines]|uniref:Uncharacterized protein n=1 Tax=Aphis glycines TaxID=307491 RepID=A0A6G0T2F9_APHGL|nr:hypothetical protein AGLY_015221 [Aphis glycines]
MNKCYALKNFKKLCVIICLNLPCNPGYPSSPVCPLKRYNIIFTTYLYFAIPASPFKPFNPGLPGCPLIPGAPLAPGSPWTDSPVIDQNKPHHFHILQVLPFVHLFLGYNKIHTKLNFTIKSNELRLCHFFLFHHVPGWSQEYLYENKILNNLLLFPVIPLSQVDLNAFGYITSISSFSFCSNKESFITWISRGRYLPGFAISPGMPSNPRWPLLPGIPGIPGAPGGPFNPKLLQK